MVSNIIALLTEAGFIFPSAVWRFDINALQSDDYSSSEPQRR